MLRSQRSIIALPHFERRARSHPAATGSRRWRAALGNPWPRAHVWARRVLSSPEPVRQRRGAQTDAHLRCHLSRPGPKSAGISGLRGDGAGPSGSAALELARDGAALRAVVSFHGGLTTKAPASQGQVRASILVCTGADDPLAPSEQVIAFQQEMRAAKVEDWQVIRYGNTRHGFTNPAADGSILPAAHYHARSDRRAWSAMQLFLAEVLSRGR